MKIVNFKSGLGNQFFYYLMYLYLQQRFPNEKVYGYYNSKFLQKHNGLELQNLLDITMPPVSRISNMTAFLCRFLSKVIKKLKADDITFSDEAIYYDGWWQDKKYYLGHEKQLCFRHLELDANNCSTLELIQNTNSVSLHVRRGDYLDADNVKVYGGICTLDYYKKAVNIISQRMDNPHYFVFSNDIEWAKENIKLPLVTYVSDNDGIKSHLDLYLMSHCKANILANSSFSYWAAMMNEHPEKLVICPQIWNHNETPDIFPREWIRI